MFTKFRDLKTKEQQSTSMELAEHAKTVMSTLDEGIKSLDDMDAFLTYLHEVGASHTKIPGFNRQYFWVSPKKRHQLPFISCNIHARHVTKYKYTMNMCPSYRSLTRGENKTFIVEEKNKVLYQLCVYLLNCRINPQVFLI